MEQIDAETNARYETLSPIYSSIHRADRRVPLLPDDPMWAAELRRSVQARMDGVGLKPEEPLFDIVEVHDWSQDGWRVNEDYVRTCAHCEFTLRTDELTSRFIQRQGIGEGSGLGQSCVIPTDHKPPEGS
jgi:CRISPR/Cas system endoribonuclease Cas6 (RAMP superfamily)